MITLNGSLDIIFMLILLLFSFILLNTTFGIYLYKNNIKIKSSIFLIKENYLWHMALLLTVGFIIWLTMLIIYGFITTNIINLPYYDTGRIVIGISIAITILLSIFFLTRNNYKKNVFFVIFLIFNLIFLNISQIVVDYYKLASFAITNEDILFNYQKYFANNVNDLFKKRVLVIGIDGIPYNWLYIPVTYPILFDQSNESNQQTIFKYQYPFYSEGAFESMRGWTSLLTGSNNLSPREKNIFELIHEYPTLKDIKQSSLAQWDWINDHIVDKDDNFVHKKTTNLTNAWTFYNGIIGNYNITKDIINDINNNHHFIFSQFVLGDDMNHMHYPIYSRYAINQNQDVNQKITMLTKLIKKREEDFKENWLIIITTDHGRNTNQFSYNHNDNFSSHQSFFVANKNLTTILKSEPKSQYNLKEIILNYFLP